MVTTLERTEAVLTTHLLPGETVVAAVQAQLDGGTMRLATRIGFAAGAGAVGGTVVAMSAGGDGDLEQRLANGLVFAVTDRRVVLLEVSAVSARPKEPVASIDRSDIVDVATGEKRVMLVKLPTIALTLRDEQVLRFEIPKVARGDARAVATALQA